MLSFICLFALFIYIYLFKVSVPRKFERCCRAGWTDRAADYTRPLLSHASSSALLRVTSGHPYAHSTAPPLPPVPRHTSRAAAQAERVRSGYPTHLLRSSTTTSSGHSIFLPHIFPLFPIVSQEPESLPIFFPLPPSSRTRNR
jgi:hypothetical protein